MSFVHLSVHTYYSFLTGLGKPSVFTKRAKELEMPGLAITDAGNLYGAFEFYKACKEQGINPIIGVDATISAKGRANRDADNVLYAITLLARSHTGYRNLIQLVTHSYLGGMYYGRPRIDWELLQQYSGDLIALSGDTYGEIGQHISAGRSETHILERIRYYQGIFGADNYYLELQEHPERANQTKVNGALVGIARRYGYPLVATNGVYYARSEDAEAQDLISCIGDGRALDDPDRPSRIEGDYSLRPADEMAELFARTPDALANTLAINEKIHIDIPYGKTLIPIFTLDTVDQDRYGTYIASLSEDDGLQRLGEEEWNLRTMCIEGLNYRFDFGFSEADVREFTHKKSIPPSEKQLSKMSVEELVARSQAFYTDAKKVRMEGFSPRYREIVDRLEYELTVVDLMGFNGYFNIVADFIRYAKTHHVPVGPWRWSAAGALLAYLSGITDIDPLRYGLLFERFLNPARISMPDIDVDFSDEGREEVFRYVQKKYGDDHVAQICTFGTMAARAAVKDVGKALGIPFTEMNDLAKLIPSKPGTKLKEALEHGMEFKQAYEREPRYRKVIDHAVRLEGSVRQLGVHACAVIIAPRPMTEYCALQHPPKDNTAIVTQLSQYPIEELGLLKMDFLGLRNLTILDRCLRIVREVHGREIDLLRIDYEDQKVFKIFAEGDTTGVFQFESRGMRKYLQELQPNAFEDIIVMVSLYRPGPLLYIPTYIARKHGREKVSYPHKSLENILKATQGIAVYQEQIMQLVQAFAGFSLGEADILRRAIGKKKVDLLMEQKEKFIKAADSQGHPEKLARYIFEEIIEPFAGYGFNKSHAACYSMISYQTAYLKAYYPTEFMTALMVSDEDDMERITLEIDECKRKKINILPPDVNESKKHFTYIDAHTIRFGLKAIKGLGDGAIRRIIEGREEHHYDHILDLVSYTGSEVVNKKSLEALIMSGALDSLGERASLLSSTTAITAYLKEHEKKSSACQIGLFDMGGEAHASHDFALAKAVEMSYEEKIKGEKSIIGYSVSGHALDGLGRYVRSKTLGMEHIRAYQKLQKERHDQIMDEELHQPLSVVTETDAASEPWEGVAVEDTLSTPNETVSPEEETAPEPVPETKEPKKNNKDAMKKVRCIGLVASIRRIQTKSGKMMLTAQCESHAFRFSIVIFPKDYEAYAEVIQQDMIAIVEGSIRMDDIRDDIGVIANSVRMMSITSIRRQAEEMGLYDPRDRVSYAEVEEDPEEVSAPVGSTPPVEQPKEPNTPTTYTIPIPSGATRDDLLLLKSYLETLPSGGISVWIDVQGKRIDTKKSVKDIEGLKAWVGENL